MINAEKSSLAACQTGRSLPPPVWSSDEMVIATYSIGRGQTARIVISGELTTEKSIDKLLARMKEDKEDLVEHIYNEKIEASDN